MMVSIVDGLSPKKNFLSPKYSATTLQSAMAIANISSSECRP